MSLQRNTAAVRRFARLARFGNWLQNLPNRVTPPPFRLMQIGSAFWQSRALHAAVRLDVATQLGDGTRSAEELADDVAAMPDPLYRLLRMLAAMGIFEEVTPRRFRNNRISHWLRADNPKNVRAMILMHNSPEMARPWFERFEDGIRNGSAPFQMTHGELLFDYLDHHDEPNTLFNQAMDSVESLTGDSYASDFDWGRFARLIDIGGGNGAKAATILKHHPGLQALVFDRASVVQGATEPWADHLPETVRTRLRFEAGDARAAVPMAKESGDIYLLSAVLHGFDDASCEQILGRIAAASTGTDARIAILELVLPELGADLASASFDLQMFMGTSGRERSDGEWQRLFAASGLWREEVVQLRSFGQIQVLRRIETTA